MKKVIVIAGPTASGKTAVSIEVAKLINGEIVSSDSVQVYTGLDIGSAKVTEEEKSGIKHHMIDVVSPKQDYNMFEFQKEAEKCIKQIHSNNKIPMIVGGTGFYIQSVLKDFNFEEEKANIKINQNENNNENNNENQNLNKDRNVDLEPISYRETLENEAKLYGNEYVHNKLKEIDIDSYNQIHYNNLKRVIRALEYYKNNGKPISKHNNEEKKKEYKYDVDFFVLYFEDREKLYSRVDERVDIMVRDGLFEEVEKLISNGVSKESTAMQAIGYKEVIEYVDGKITKQEAIDKIKINTRHLVKRQYTWFKHQVDDSIWIPVDTNDFDIKKIANEIVRRIKDDSK